MVIFVVDIKEGRANQIKGIYGNIHLLGGNGYWTQCADSANLAFAGYRSAAVGFAVNGKGYVSTGI